MAATLLFTISLPAELAKGVVNSCGATLRESASDQASARRAFERHENCENAVNHRIGSDEENEFASYQLPAQGNAPDGQNREWPILHLKFGGQENCQNHKEVRNETPD